MIKILSHPTITTLFTLNQVPYTKGSYEIYIANLERTVPEDDLNEVKAHVGIRHKVKKDKLIQIAVPINKYLDSGDVPYTSLDTLLTDLTTVLADQSSTPPPATEATSLLILSQLQQVNSTLVNNTNALLTDIRDSNVIQETLITATNTVLGDIDTLITSLESQGTITNTELADLNTELNNIETTLNSIEVADSNFHSSLTTSQSSIITLLGNINTDTTALDIKLNTLISQTDQVETLLGNILTAIGDNSTANVSSLEQLRLLLVSIDTNTDALESELINIISEHDQTQLLLTTLTSLLTVTNESHVVITGTNISIPSGFKTILINSLGGTNILDFGGGNTFELGGGRRADGITLEGTNLNTKNGLLPAITITGGTWQWIVLSTLTI